MPRSSRRRAAENRARIVAAASDLFRARGVGAVGLAEVMRAAGMTQGGFYKHFVSKDALAAEACAFAFAAAAENWRRVARDAAEAGHDAAEALAAHYLAPRPPERTCPMVALAAEAARRSPDDPLRRAYVAGVRDLYAVYAELVEAEEDRGRARFAAMVGASALTRPGVAGFDAAVLSA